MTHETLGDAEEQELFRAVKRATDLVEGGMTPDDATEKVARAERFGPGKIRTIAHAYNTGKQTNQWRQGGSILDKLATFDLVDPEAVIGRIYSAGASTKQASDTTSDEYLYPPSWLEEKQRQKIASAPLLAVGPPVEAYQVDPLCALHKAYGNVQQHKQATEELSRQASKAEDTARNSVAALVTYFKRASYDRLPFHLVEGAARTYFGTPAIPLMDLVYQHSHLREKRAVDRIPATLRPLDLRITPFTLIKDCIKAAEDCLKHRQLLHLGREKAAAAKEDAFRPFCLTEASRPLAATSSPPAPSSNHSAKTGKQAGWATEVAAIATGDIMAHKATHREKDEDPYGDIMELEEDTSAIDEAADEALHAESSRKPFKKEAILGAPAVNLAVGSMLGRTLGSAPKTKDDLIEDAWMDLEDPDHQNEIRKIKAHAMLNSMLTDPDDPISAHDHDRVLTAYNEISQLAPRAAENSASLRPLLRRKLEGHTEPFEVKETTDIEKSLAGTRSATPNTSLLQDTPDKLLG